MPFDNTTSVAVRVKSDAQFLLEAARERLSDPRVWCQGFVRKIEDGLVRVCAVGAINDAANADVYADVGVRCVDAARCYSALLVLSMVIPPEWKGSVIDFNDHPDTQHSDVLAAFDRAIMLEESNAV